MEVKPKIFFLILIFYTVALLDNANSTFPLFNKFIRQGIRKSPLAPKCSPSIRPLPSIPELLQVTTCLKPIPWKNGSRKHPEQDLRASQVILKYGYNLVTYNNVTTKDGYILTVHRIVGSSLSAPRSGKHSVLLFHGIGTASDEWVLQSEEKKNLPMRLANEGYDVWIANARGTDLSKGHVSMNPNWELKYWDFTFHEVAIYDFPAIIDLMTHETGNEKIFFIGHNTAANVYAAALAEKPELNDKIEASVLLGPSIFMGHSYSPLRPLFNSMANLSPLVQGQINGVIQGKLPFGNWMINPILARFCTPTAIKCGVCGNLMFYLYGYDAPQINFRDIPNIVSKATNSISFKSALHLGQNIKTCDFRKYDYGRINNQKLYGQEQPPQYNLTNLRAPIYIYFGNGDNLATIEDIVMTRNALPKETVKEIVRVQWKLFNNADFVIAKDADVLVYKHILENFKEHLAKKYNLNRIASPITKTEKISGKSELSVHIYGNSNGITSTTTTTAPTTTTTTTTPAFITTRRIARARLAQVNQTMGNL